MTVQSPALPELTHLAEAKRQFALTIPHIEAAAARSVKVHAALSTALADAAPENCGLVVFGSLARQEMTAGSDVDWTLLVDGPADPHHREAMQAMDAEIKRIGEEFGFNAPNEAGAFGAMTFSHDLVHAIGGESDSNKNTTKRILLMSEATGISRQKQVVDRVVRSILDRYFQQELSSRKKQNYLPRFLLNDVVRLWRTMAVDYAAKNSDRNLKKWAVRNAKLRFSRKLIFVKGLLLAFETVLSSDVSKLARCEGSSLVPALIGMVQPAIQLPPLEILARALLRETAKGWSEAAETSRSIFHSYDEFLGIMGDAQKRRALEALDINDAVEDPAFERIRVVSRKFERGLIKFLLDGPENVRNLTRDYAIF